MRSHEERESIDIYFINERKKERKEERTNGWGGEEVRGSSPKSD